jgi:uncharacterized protein
MNRSFHLYQLQKIDSQLNTINTRLTEIENILNGDLTVKNARAAKEQASKDLYHQNTILKEIETELQNIQIKIGQSESALYGGKVKIPKELQALEAEIASLKKQVAALEEKQLDQMIVVEQAEKNLSGQTDSLAQIEVAFISQSAQLKGEKSTLEAQQSRLTIERNLQAQQIEATDLATYEKLRKVKRGLAVVVNNDGCCSACGAEFSPAEIQAARAPQQIIFCAICGRILYSG